VIDELDVRRAAMTYVADCAAASGGVITRLELEAFHYEGQQIKLIDQSRASATRDSWPRQSRS
jgi:hypothetical protein